LTNKKNSRILITKLWQMTFAI